MIFCGSLKLFDRSFCGSFSDQEHLMTQFYALAEVAQLFSRLISRHPGIGLNPVTGPQSEGQEKHYQVV